MTDAENIDVDTVLRKMGFFGRHEIRNCILYFIPVVFTSMFTINFIFTAGVPEYRCAIPECENPSNTELYPEWLKTAVPFKDQYPSRCTKFPYNYNFNNSAVNGTCSENNFNRNTIEKCDEFVFDTEKITIANDFDILCDENLWMLTFIGTIHNVGECLCLPLNGYFSDRYGRRTMMVLGVFFSAIVGLIRSFSTSYVSFAFLEFLDPFLGSGVYGTAVVLGMETVEPSKRVMASSIICSAYAVGEAIIGIVAWLTVSWRTILQIMYAPALLIIVYFWMVPESVRWLIANKRFDDVNNILFKLTKNNNGITPYVELLSNEKKGTKSYNRGESNLSNIFKSVPLVLRILFCSFCWISCNFIFYGLSLNSVAVAGNIYLNFIIVSLVEIPGYISCYVFLEKYGRKATLTGSFVVSGISCIAFIFVGEDLVWLQLTLSMIGKFAITISFTTVYIFTTELFPTPVRHSVLGMCSMFGKIGGIVAPQMPLLAIAWQHLPVLLFGVVSILSGFLALAFPETLNTALPETIEEAENLGIEKILKNSKS